MTAKRRVKYTPHKPRAVGTSWSFDIHSWPLHSQPHGYQYAAVFVERRTRWVYVHFLKNKSDVVHSLDSLRKYVAKNFSWCRLEHIWSDEEGGLLKESTVGDWSDQMKVHIECVPPDQHWRNSTAESSQYQLELLTNIGLKFASLPRSYWPFAYAHAVWCLNRRPNSALVGKDREDQ